MYINEPLILNGPVAQHSVVKAINSRPDFSFLDKDKKVNDRVTTLLAWYWAIKSQKQLLPGDKHNMQVSVQLGTLIAGFKSLTNRFYGLVILER